MRLLILLFVMINSGAAVAKLTSAGKKTIEQKSSPEVDKKKREELIKQMHIICMEKFPRTVDKRKLTCDCLTRNFNQKLSNNDLVILLKDYKTADSRKSQKPVVNDPNEALYMFNIDVSEACIKNPKWKLGDPE